MFGETSLSIPLSLRPFTPQSMIMVVQPEMIINNVAARMDFELSSTLKTTVDAVPLGEVDRLFPQAVMVDAGEGKFELQSGYELSRYAAELARSILIMQSKANMDDMMAMGNAWAGLIGKKGEILKPETVNQIFQRRNLLASNVMSSAPLLTEANFKEIALMYAGTGLTAMRTEPGEIHSFMRRMLSLKDAISKDDTFKVRSKVATFIYLTALDSYDTLFVNKQGMSPAAFQPAKAAALYDYAHMFLGVHLSKDVLGVLIAAEQLAALAQILKPSAYWTPITEMNYTDLLSRIDIMVRKNPLMMGDYFAQALNDIKQVNDVTAISAPEYLGITDELGDVVKMGDLPISQGETSLYFPLSIDKVIQVANLERMIASFSELMRTTMVTVAYIVNITQRLQITEDIIPRLHPVTKFKPEPKFFHPRYASMLDDTRSIIGLSKKNAERYRVLAKYINGPMSYRQVHDQLVHEQSWGVQIMRRDMAQALNVPLALTTLPVPEPYLLGENAHPIMLCEDVMTQHVQLHTELPGMRYMRAVELMFFKPTFSMWAFNATLLSGTFTVIMSKERLAAYQDSPGFKKVTKIAVSPDFFAIIPGVMPVLEAPEKDSISAPADEVNLAYAYGVAVRTLIERNLNVRLAKIGKDVWVKEDVLVHTMWSDDNHHFGLMPHCSIPAPQRTELVYSVLNGTAAVLQNRISTDEIKWIDDFLWTNIFYPIPHMSFRFTAREYLAAWGVRAAICSSKIIIYSSDVITTPTADDLTIDPRPWAVTTAPSGVDDTTKIMNEVKAVVNKLDTKLPPDTAPTAIAPIKEPVKPPFPEAGDVVPVGDVAPDHSLSSVGDVTIIEPKPVTDEIIDDQVEAERRKKKKQQVPDEASPSSSAADSDPADAAVI